MTKVLVITVSYNSAVSVAEFLNSVQSLQRSPEVRVVVVENSCQEEQALALRTMIAQFSNVELLESSRNRGYFGASRLAFDHYLTGHGLPDWVIVCNPDVVIEDEDFFSRLLTCNPMAAAVIAPRIQVLPAKIDQNPFMRRRPGWFRWTSLRLIYCNYYLASIWDWLSRQKQAIKGNRRGPLSKTPSNRSPRAERIYAAHGSFFIFGRRYFEAGGYLDASLFLYGEEVSVAEICRSKGLPIIYEPSLHIMHREHQSTGRVISRFSYECQKKALRYVTSLYW